MAIAKGPFHVSEKIDWQELKKEPQVFRVLIDALIEAGANVNTHDERHGFSPLHLAVLHRDVALVTTLLKRGANQDCQDKEHRTPRDLLKLETDQIKKILTEQCSAFTLNTDDWSRRGDELHELMNNIRSFPVL